MFDFDKAEADARKDLDNKSLQCLVLGPSGSGKSALLGTFGVKTLFLYGSTENHGPVSAKKFGGDNIRAICIARDDDGKDLDANETYQRVLAILDSDLVKRGIKAIAIDGATELEGIIRNTTQWQQLCTTDKGKHNGFAEPSATIQMLRPIFARLKKLNLDHDIMYGMSLILKVREYGDNGEIMDSEPSLSGYSVADWLCQQFPDYFAIGPMVKGDKEAHRIQFLAGIAKSAKDQNGRVKKTLNFKPRVTGVLNPPATMDANLSKVAELKKGA